MPAVLYLLIGLILLGGCAPATRLPVEPVKEDQRPYISEIDLPEAKAYFAYAQFRLLIIDNRWQEGIEALRRALAFDPDSELLRLSLAKAYLHTQQLEPGGEELEALLAVNPRHFDAWELLGELRSYQERYPEAVKAYRTVLAAQPANEALRLRLIAVYDQQNETQKAIAETNTLLGLNPESLAGRLALARLQRGNRQTDEAIKTYRDLLVRRPGQLQAILELGQLLEKEQQVNQAIDLYRESIRDNPELLAVYRQLARILILQERYDEALSLLREALRQSPDNQQILRRIGLLQLSQEDFVGGEATFRRLLELEPDGAHSLFSLGMALIGQHRNEEALAVLERIEPGTELYPEALLQIAYLRRQEGDLEGAIGLLQGAVDSGDQPEDTYYYLAAFLGEAGRFAEAGRAVRRGLETYPDNANLHYQLGVIYERMDDRAQALEEMNRVLGVEPRHADALNFIAYHYAERGENLEQALEQARTALEQKKTSYIYDTFGWVLYRMGRFEEAQHNLAQAVALDGDDPLLNEHLGDILAALQRWAEAEKAYRRVLELNPEAEGVPEKLERLLKDHPNR